MSILQSSASSGTEPVALIDLDGTLADFDKAMETRMAELASPLELANPPEAGTTQPWVKARQKLIRSQPGFWEGLAPIPEGFAVLEKLREYRFGLNVLTKGPFSAPAAWTEKFRWCQNYVPDAQVTITQDKGLTYGKVLFDDWPEYILRWLEWRPRGLVIMLDHAYNQEFSHPNVFRYQRGLQAEEFQQQDKDLSKVLKSARTR